MYIMETRRIRKKMDAIYHQTSVNIVLWNLFAYALRRRFCCTDTSRIERFQKEHPEVTAHFSSDQLLLAGVLAEVMERQIDEMEEEMVTLISALGGSEAIPFEKTLLDMATNGHVYSKKSIEQDPYLQSIHIKETTVGRYTLGFRSYYKNELTEDWPPIIDKAGYLSPYPALFAEEIHLPCIRDGEWIVDCIAPYQWNLAQEVTEDAAGHVLLLGLGLGYIAFHASQKNSVKHITIVEHDADLRRLFAEEILPQFPQKEKISLVDDDPLSYFCKTSDGAFDFAIVDTVENECNLVPYLRYHNHAKHFRKTLFLHSCEDVSFYERTMQTAQLLVNQYASGDAMFPIDEDDPSAGSYAFLDRLTRNLRITKADQIDELMTLDGLLSLMDESR